MRGNAADSFRDRIPAGDVPGSATFPSTLRLPMADEAAAGVAVAYEVSNFAVYRAVVERLRSGERFRMETSFGTYVLTREEFEENFPNIVRSASYSTGSPSMPGRCYYVVGPPPAAAARFAVRPS
jgi:hypothetical protein